MKHTFDAPGCYLSAVSVVDAAGKPGAYALTEGIRVNGKYYVWSEAPDGGDGSEASPFNRLADAASRTGDGGDVIYLKGRIAVSEKIVFNGSNLVVATWPGETDRAVVAVEAHDDFAKNDTVFKIASAAVTILNLDFEVEAAALKSSAKLFVLLGASTTFESCDFELLNGTPTWSGNGQAGIIFADNGASIAELVVQNCHFSDFNNGSIDQVYKLLCVGNDAKIIGNVFERCAYILSNASGYIPNVHFMSNVVRNTSSVSTTSKDCNCGSLFRAVRGDFGDGMEIAYNIFLNDEKGGIAVNDQGTLASFKLAKFHHNTVVGYDGFILSKTTEEIITKESELYKMTSYIVFDNLLVNTDVALDDQRDKAWLTDKTVVRNNYLKGGEGAAVVKIASGLDGTRAIIVDNKTMDSMPVFKSTTFGDPDFYRPKAAKTDPIVSGGWTDNGKYPAYIGAVEPLVTGGMIILVR